MEFNPNYAQPKPSDKHSRVSRFGSAIILILFAIFYFGIVLLVFLIELLFTGKVGGSFWGFHLPFVLGPLVASILVAVGLFRGKKWAYIGGGIIAVAISLIYPAGTIAGLLMILFIYWIDKHDEEKIERYVFTILFIAFVIFSTINGINKQVLPDFNIENVRFIGFYDPEIRYWITARELKSHEVCYLTDPKSFIIDEKAPKREQVYYLRSRCIIDISIITKNLSLCEQVISAGKVKINNTVLDGTKISADECRKRVESEKQLYIPNDLYIFNMDNEWDYYFDLLHRIGYTDQNLLDYFGYTELGLTDGKKFYDKIKDTPEFKDRLRNVQQ